MTPGEAASRRPASVWVTRPEPGNAATTAALRSAGLAVVSVPLLETRVRVDDPPAGLPVPDLVIFVSANAVRGLDEALTRPGWPAVPRAEVLVAAVGRKTAEAAEAAGWTVSVSPVEQNADGMLRELAGRDVAGRNIWIPAGNRPGSATRDLPEALRARRAEVFVLPVYETAARTPGSGELLLLDAATPGAAVLHSPSSAEAFYAPDAPEAVRRWARAAVPVSIGPVTTRRLNALGAGPVVECSVPSDGAVAATVIALDIMNPTRNSP